MQVNFNQELQSIYSKTATNSDTCDNLTERMIGGPAMLCDPITIFNGGDPCRTQGY